ncbi:metal-sensitive transcriptional regulator [Nocardioides jishulii]|uniref:Metal-sensitive transcriptional regulator n=1 Tax=Nocardioides jishulii TaxID=2575440 RepID=A0A4U2YS07_9ACTN|nr:metal-sensitive transcriptional regulator [Nocardioides jishulii]QCX28904.1 metal-sensitive transcriptional regulator [Nocardioides jishulii]TKI64198.1 metal-sensitive transcriptional regulator [Nocardioides jishulii]
MEIDPTDIKSVIARLKRANGHMASVIRMLEDGADCEDAMTQLAAVNKAVQRASFSLVATGLQQCLVSGDGIDDEQVQRLQKVFLSMA